MLRTCERFWLVSEALAVALTTFGCSDSGSATGTAVPSSTASTTGATTSTTAGSGGSAASSTSTVGSGGSGGGAGSAVTTGGSAGSTGGGGAGGQPCVIGADPRPTSLPFAMDQYFVASGWMQPALIQQAATCAYPPVPGNAGASDAGTSDASTVDAGSSTPPRPALAGTKCWTITYTPVVASDWAGVDWQFPTNNWGTGDGLVIPPGATKVSLVAWGDVGGEKVSFNVGYGALSTDGFGVSLPDQLLTTVPTVYAVSLIGVSYTCPSVRMGFGWIAAGATKSTFHIADIRWE